MALGEFFYWAVDPSGSTMDQSRKMRTQFLQRAVKLFQTSFVGQIRTTQRNGQTFLRGNRLQVFGSLFVVEIVRDYHSTRPREAQRNGLADAACAPGNQNRFVAQRKQIIPACAYAASVPSLCEKGAYLSVRT